MRREKKIDDSITAKIRRKLKEKYTPKIARFFHPTTLNLIGLAGSIFAGISFILTSKSPWWFLGAIIGILVHFFSDEFDGAVARFRKMTSEHGYYLDHMLDEISVFVIFFGLGISPLMHLSLALMIVIVYYIISMNVFLTTYVRGWFQISFEGLGPREGELAIIGASIITLFLEYPGKLFETNFLGLKVITFFDLAGFVSLGILIFLAVRSISSTIYYLKRFEKKYKVKSFLELLNKIKIKTFGETFFKK